MGADPLYTKAGEKWGVVAVAGLITNNHGVALEESQPEENELRWRSQGGSVYFAH